jgi:hypothetical protein
MSAEDGENSLPPAAADLPTDPPRRVVGEPSAATFT